MSVTLQRRRRSSALILLIVLLVSPLALPSAPVAAADTAVHVGDLDGSASIANLTRWRADVRIVVHGDSHTPIKGARITGYWGDNPGVVASCTSKSDGGCTVANNQLPASTPSISFTVTNVAYSSYLYDAAANHDPDGDSTGTVIIVNRPAGLAPTPTDEPTFTPTPTDEPTSTPTPTDEPTSTATATDEPTLTPTPTDEPTSTPTPTDEPTLTPTPTDEPTFTPTPTDEPTFTPTPTDEPTSTPTPTDEPTFTPTPTDEPTLTPTPTDEPTFTPTPTDEPTFTPTPTDEPTFAPTATDEPTFAPTATDEPTFTPTPTDEPTLTPTPTDEPTSTPTPTDEPTFTPTPTDEPTLTPTPADRPLNLLFFGNSLTQIGEVPRAVARLADAAGHDFPVYVRDTVGGANVDTYIERVASSPDSSVTNATLPAGQTWDYIIVQGSSLEATAQNGSYAGFAGDILQLYRAVEGHASGKGAGARGVLFETAAYRTGWPYYPDSYAGPSAMQDDISAGYAAAQALLLAEAPSSYAAVAEVGEAFRAADFSADLYHVAIGDYQHYDKAGPFLAAMVIYKAIYGGRVTDILYSAAVNADFTSTYMYSAGYTLSEADYNWAAALADGMTSFPTPTPTATDEPTSTPTATDEPTFTPTPTPTDEPTSTPTPTATDEPTSTPTPTDEPTPDLLAALAASWELEESGIESRRDASGNGFDLTPSSAISSVTGVSGVAAHFDLAAGQRLYHAGAARLNTHQSHTITGFIKVATLPSFGVYRTVLQTGAAWSGYGGVSIKAAYNEEVALLVYQGASSAVLVCHAPYRVNDWTFFATRVSVEGAAVHIETWSDAEGTLAKAEEISGSMTLLPDNPQFGVGGEMGVNPAGGWFDGAIDQLRVWDRVLTPEELDLLWNNGAGWSLPGGATPTATPTTDPAFTPTAMPSPTAGPTLTPTPAATPTVEPAITPTATPTQPTTINLPDGLIAYWKFDEPAGEQRVNSAPGSHIGDFIETGGQVATAPGHIYPRALHFPGAVYASWLDIEGGRDGFGELETDIGPEVGRTFAFWVKIRGIPALTNPLHYHTIYRRGSAGNGNSGGGTQGGEVFNLNADGMVWGTLSGIGQTTGYFVHGPTDNRPYDTWALYISRYDPAADRFDIKHVTASGFQNGENVANTTGTFGSIAWAVTVMSVGRPWVDYRAEQIHPDGYLDADVGPIAIWNRALTEAEAVAYFNNGNGVDLVPSVSETPTPTPTPTMTLTVEPTATLTPTVEPTAIPTPTEEPVAMPTPTAEPTVTPTEAPPMTTGALRPGRKLARSGAM